MCMCGFRCTCHTVHMGNQRTTSGLPPLVDLEMKRRSSHLSANFVLICAISPALHITSLLTIVQSLPLKQVEKFLPEGGNELQKPQKANQTHKTQATQKITRLWRPLQGYMSSKHFLGKVTLFRGAASKLGRKL